MVELMKVKLILSRYIAKTGIWHRFYLYQMYVQK